MPNDTARPFVVYPPGDTIREEIKERGWSQRHFAEVIGRPKQFVSDLLNGKRELTPDTALRLEAALGPSAEFWLRLEAKFRVYTAARDSRLLDEIRSRAIAV